MLNATNYDREDSLSEMQVGYFSNCILMLKSLVGIGVLGIPSVFQIVGLIPGVILLLAIHTITLCKTNFSPGSLHRY